MTKLTDMPVLTLVCNGTRFYPKKEEDHVLLFEAGVPISGVDAEFLPLLTFFLAKRKIKLVKEDFSDLETLMLTKVKTKWEHGIITAANQIVLFYPKSLKQLDPSSLIHAIQDWYKNHSIKTEVVHKRTIGSKRIIIKKLL